MEGTKQLIQALEKERTQRNLDHRAFSTLLGIHESYWHRIRTEERQLTPNLAVMFMQKLPELGPAVTDFVVSQGNNNQKEE